MDTVSYFSARVTVQTALCALRHPLLCPSLLSPGAAVLKGSFQGPLPLG